MVILNIDHLCFYEDTLLASITYWELLSHYLELGLILLKYLNYHCLYLHIVSICERHYRCFHFGAIWSATPDVCFADHKKLYLLKFFFHSEPIKWKYFHCFHYLIGAIRIGQIKEIIQNFLCCNLWIYHSEHKWLIVQYHW